MYKKFYLLLPFCFWIGLCVFEVWSLFFQYPKPMYIRGWEHVVNEGKDSYYVPFRPFIKYDGPMVGDMPTMSYFIIPKSDIRYQVIQIDEYGFRNRIGLLNKPIDAVVVGTSFVGGAQETQKNLVPDLLIDKYGIRAYNYATQTLMQFWGDKRFIKNPPKFLIVLATENEVFMEGSYVDTLTDSLEDHEVKKWSSNKAWDKENNAFIYDYNHIVTYTNRFSILRYDLRIIYKYIINTFYSKKTLADRFLTRDYAYDPTTKIFFWNINSPYSIKNKENEKTIKRTLQDLKNTRDILKKRGMQLIVGIMPNKGSLYGKPFKNIPADERSLPELEKAMEKDGIEHINLFEPTFSLAKSGKLVYYKDDGHWNSEANRIIADLLAKKIKEIQNKESY